MTGRGVRDHGEAVRPEARGRRRAARPATVAAALNGARARQLGAYVFVAIVFAVITGPTGNSTHPFHAARRAVFAPRIILFLAIALALWLLVIGWSRLRATAAPALQRAWAPAGNVLDRPVGRIGLNLVLLAVAIIAPLVVSTAAQQSMVSDIGIYALLALGLNVVVGYAGLLDLGYIAFFAVGAYVTAYVSSKTAMPWHAPFTINPFFAFPIALLVAGLAGVVLGAPTLRLRGDYLAIVTLGFGEIIQLIANNSDNITNGARGVFGVPHLSVHLLGINYSWALNPRPYYYLLLVIIVIVMFAFGRLERSRIGRAWAAIREDEIAAEAMGVNTTAYKVRSFVISSFFAGVAGGLFAHFVPIINPGSFTFVKSMEIVVMVVAGGLGSTTGSIVAAIFLSLLPEALRTIFIHVGGEALAQTVDQLRMPIYGILLIVLMLARPQGLFGTHELWDVLPRWIPRKRKGIQ
jgi:branched-chain amino acid transport system permease protein